MNPRLHNLFHTLFLHFPRKYLVLQFPVLHFLVLHIPVPHFPPSGFTPNLFLHFPFLHFPPSDFTPNIVLHFPVLHFPTIVLIWSFLFRSCIFSPPNRSLALTDVTFCISFYLINSSHLQSRPRCHSFSLTVKTDNRNYTNRMLFKFY